ncbi:MAG: polysaccharide deacetylase family protein [Natronomonas sp.]|jgi:peptidoglycan/xylan/chitin deacetylase (PgdA/CDA1 family)|uniref:polysaccharide deacetylase family protein n=1 Tax=Natronomonas sp. TaxID=2184060 RepID=UPI002870198F|nr:polysaccharide deacetylase family protein [Natronomonas sp.]MDR9380833.1 polysaccharide deacetylase family protein [Natronomonas sp.]MDR9429374.1 polysaccharide deacetylase family protein [Natronomonas sp.]
MDEISELRQREVETYFNVIARGGSDRLIRARSFHNLGEYTADDFDQVATLLDDADASGSFAFLGRDAARYGNVISRLADAGHEIVLHGHRHVACGDLPYETAHQNLSLGIEAIEDAGGVTPAGFFSPLQDLSQGTLDAADELGLEWLLGKTDGDVPAGITLIEPQNPYDLVLLNRGESPGETFEELDAVTEPGAAFLFHPNMLEYYDALAEFETWVDETEPVSIESYVDDGGVGIVLDAMRPLRIE